MNQQIDVFLTLDAKIGLDVHRIKKCIKSAVISLGSDAKLVEEIKLYEEAGIYGNSPACEELIEALGKALDWIAQLTADDSEEHQEPLRWKNIQSVYAKHICAGGPITDERGDQ